ncbi:Crp/Fnr family transcriptional regulator [Pleomorphochaeta sp. DL1XJH-081]|uniref:Crp/Fnr family transcriptional regulator n=1 Tax=Pleomorphochaeta sp. DL1XJH-081 TaxID=3409690 RepID=UPI003BB78B46
MVNNFVVELLEKVEGLTDVEKETLAENLPVRTFEKGYHLLRQGAPYRECFHIFKGCVRQYFLDDEGNEKTVAFFTEGDTAALLDTAYLKKPSPYFWECTEETTVLVGDLASESDILEQYPALQKLIRDMLEENLGKSQASLSTYISSSPEQRYLNLVRTRADLLERVPQYQIASFLGITAESLSRIRKRLSSSFSLPE